MKDQPSDHLTGHAADQSIQQHADALNPLAMNPVKPIDSMHMPNTLSIKMDWLSHHGGLLIERMDNKLKQLKFTQLRQRTKETKVTQKNHQPVRQAVNDQHQGIDPASKLKVDQPSPPQSTHPKKFIPLRQQGKHQHTDPALKLKIDQASVPQNSQKISPLHRQDNDQHQRTEPAFKLRISQPNQHQDHPKINPLRQHSNHPINLSKRAFEQPIVAPHQLKQPLKQYYPKNTQTAQQQKPSQASNPPIQHISLMIGNLCLRLSQQVNRFVQLLIWILTKLAGMPSLLTSFCLRINAILGLPNRLWLVLRQCTEAMAWIHRLKDGLLLKWRQRQDERQEQKTQQSLDQTPIIDRVQMMAEIALNEPVEHIKNIRIRLAKPLASAFATLLRLAACLQNPQWLRIGWTLLVTQLMLVLTLSALMRLSSQPNELTPQSDDALRVSQQQVEVNAGQSNPVDVLTPSATANQARNENGVRLNPRKIDPNTINQGVQRIVTAKQQPQPKPKAKTTGKPNKHINRKIPTPSTVSQSRC